MTPLDTAAQHLRDALVLVDAGCEELAVSPPQDGADGFTAWDDAEYARAHIKQALRTLDNKETTS